MYRNGDAVDPGFDADGEFVNKLSLREVLLQNKMVKDKITFSIQ